MRSRQTVMLLKRVRSRSRFSFSRTEKTRGACKHDQWGFFSRGREEYPFCRAHMQREREARTSVMDGNYSHPLFLSPFPSYPPTLLNFSRWAPNNFTPAWLDFCNWAKQLASSLSVCLKKLTVFISGANIRFTLLLCITVRLYWKLDTLAAYLCPV